MAEAERKLQASCMDDFDPGALLPDQAVTRILAAVAPVQTAEKIPIRSALGRVLAADVRSSINVPHGTNSAMDGYAVHGSDIPSSGTRQLRVLGTAWAGKPFMDEVPAGACVRIMTGAVMPRGTDTVIIQERAELHGDTIIVGGDTRPGDNVREAGEDIRAGTTVLTAGARLNPAELGLLASLGIGEIRVWRKLRVAFFSTGDELRSIGEPLEYGAIYDSNRYTLYGMLARLNCEIIDLGIARDSRAEIDAALQSAAACADVVITSGGVSVGEADYVKESLERLGEINFWKISMKPGRPLAFGRVGNAVFFGLPGNPVSVMVTFYQFVQPALRKMMGETNWAPLTIRATCTSRLKKKPGRVEYQRGVLEIDTSGHAVVRKTGAQGSGILTSMALANCFIVLPLQSGNVEPGTEVDVQPFFGLI